MIAPELQRTGADAAEECLNAILNSSNQAMRAKRSLNCSTLFPVTAKFAGMRQARCCCCSRSTSLSAVWCDRNQTGTMMQSTPENDNTRVRRRVSLQTKYS